MKSKWFAGLSIAALATIWNTAFARDIVAPLASHSFDRRAHFAMLEEPGRFLSALVSEVLSLAEDAAAYSAGQRTVNK
jgi:hypothetical protein